MLRGYTAFSREDAGRAGAALVRREGAVRVKRSTGIGGRGQFVVDDERALRDVLESVGEDELASVGIVLEQNLADVRTYSAADAHFEGFVASRRNYDVVRGTDHEGRPASGVLEQSWRVGGATGAELGAIAALRADPEVLRVRARCVELYGATTTAPPGAAIHYDGVDPRVGRLLKYTLVERHAHAR